MDAIDNPSYFSLPSDASKKLRSPSSCKWSEHHSKKHVLSSSSKNKGFGNVAQGKSSLRTQSLNRAKSEDRCWFILGKPRPEDIAPSLYNGRYHHQRHNSTGNMNRSYNLLHQDMVHCRGEGDVAFFTGANDTQYYNTAAVPPTRIFSKERRRHSMESFLNRDKIFMLGSENDAKNRDVSSTRVFKEAKGLTKAAPGGAKMDEDELDILLVSCEESESATIWVNYLISCFQQISRERNNPTLKVQNIKLEDALNPSIGAGRVSEQVSGAHLRLVVICPLFLQKVVSTTSIENSILQRILHSEHSLVMILGLQDHEEDRLRKLFPEYDKWRKMSMKDRDPTFVGDFLGISMDILSRSRHLRESLNQDEESSGFSVVPKKIQVSQNKLLIFLTEALAADDLVEVFVFRNHHRIDITNAKRRNPYAIQFTMPACCFQVSMLVSVHVTKNGKSLGQRMVKCESKMRELEQLVLSLDDPIQFLCQCFSLNAKNKDQLDTFLLQNFQRNVPRDFNILGAPSSPVDNYICNEEYPTLLHFSAKYGLEKLTLKLLQSPGSDRAYRIRNSSHYTPIEMAEKANQNKLANILRRHKEMAEFSRLCNDPNRTSKTEEGFAEQNYLLPKPLDDTYLIPPNARPVDFHAIHQPDTTSPQLPSYANFKQCDFPTFHAMSTVSTSTGSPTLPSVLDNYDVPSNGQPYTPPIPSTPQSPAECGTESYSDLTFPGGRFDYSNSFRKENSYFEAPPERFRSVNTSKRASTISDPYQSSECSISSAHQLSSKEKLSPDDELLEIIRDFKNNVFSISEVEMLVQNWQNRNDVQQYFRDKKEQLTEMREEYDRVQRKMTDQMKRTTLFNRMCKLFGQSKRKQSVKNRGDQKSETGTAGGQRPSHLNLRSSSSDCLEVNSIRKRSSADQYASVGQNVDQLHFDGGMFAKIPTVEWKKDSRSHFFEPSKFLSQNVSRVSVQSECLKPTGVDSDHQNRDGATQAWSECEQRETSECTRGRHSSDSREERRIFFCSPAHKTPIKQYQKTKSWHLPEMENEDRLSTSLRSRVKSAENITLINRRANHCPSLSENAPGEYAGSHRSILLGCETSNVHADRSVKKSSSPVRESPNGVDDETVAGINSVSSSDCDSNDNSSWRSSPPLDLSSLSLADSNGASDENDETLDAFVEENETDSFHLNIFEEGDMETETAPSSIRTNNQSGYINICNIGFSEYVNVAIV